MSVIVYGPQGCGKIRNVQVLAQYFGLSNVKDNWISGDELPENTLTLTSCEGIEGIYHNYSVIMGEIEKINHLCRDIKYHLQPPRDGGRVSVAYVFYKLGIKSKLSQDTLKPMILK